MKGSGPEALARRLQRRFFRRSLLSGSHEHHWKYSYPLRKNVFIMALFFSLGFSYWFWYWYGILHGVLVETEVNRLLPISWWILFVFHFLFVVFYLPAMFLPLYFSYRKHIRSYWGGEITISSNTRSSGIEIIRDNGEKSYYPWRNLTKSKLWGILEFGGDTPAELAFFPISFSGWQSFSQVLADIFVRRQPQGQEKALKRGFILRVFVYFALFLICMACYTDAMLRTGVKTSGDLIEGLMEVLFGSVILLALAYWQKPLVTRLPRWLFNRRKRPRLFAEAIYS